MTARTPDPLRSRWSGMPNSAADKLLDELSESPLPGARYARDVVRKRLPAILRAALHVTDTPLTLCFEPGCTLPGHVSRVHETTESD